MNRNLLQIIREGPSGKWQQNGANGRYCIKLGVGYREFNNRGDKQLYTISHRRHEKNRLAFDIGVG